MREYNKSPNQTTRPLDALPGRRCGRACDELRKIRRHAHLAVQGVIARRRGPHIDELALSDLHRSGIISVGFDDPEAYIIVLRRRARR